jgi:hypothetical protein
MLQERSDSRLVKLVWPKRTGVSCVTWLPVDLPVHYYLAAHLVELAQPVAAVGLQPARQHSNHKRDGVGANQHRPFLQVYFLCCLSYVGNNAALAIAWYMEHHWLAS